MLPTQRCVEPDHLSYKGLLTHCVGSGISPLLPTGAPLLPLLGWALLGRTYGKQALVWQGIGGSALDLPQLYSPSAPPLKLGSATPPQRPFLLQEMNQPSTRLAGCQLPWQ